MKKRGRPSGVGSTLSAEKIINCARELLTGSGKIPSIRRIATELGVDAMAIYHYFSSKAVLLEAVTMDLVSDIYQPEGSEDWQAEVLQLCSSYLSLLNSHPGLLETMLSMKNKDGLAEMFRQRFEQAVSSLSPRQEIFNDALNLIADYLHGVALAMECESEPATLTVDEIQRPLMLVIGVLEHEVKA